jgi:hypothetical protein
LIWFSVADAVLPLPLLLLDPESPPQPDSRRAAAATAATALSGRSRLKR